MVAFSKIKRSFAKTIVSECNLDNAPDSVSGILMLDRNTPLEEGYIYLIDIDEWHQRSNIECNERVAIIVYGADTSLHELENTDYDDACQEIECYFAVTNLPLAQIYNDIHKVFHDEERLNQAFQDALASSKPLLNILKVATNLEEESLLLLNSTLQVIAMDIQHKHFDIPLVKKMHTKKTISDEEMDAVRDFAEVHAFSIPGFAEECYLIEIKSEDAIEDAIEDTSEDSVIDTAISYICEFLSNDNFFQYTTNQAFSRLINDILSERIVTESQINERQNSLLPLRYGNRYSLLVFMPEEETDSKPSMKDWIEILKQNFIYSEIMAYKKDVLVFTHYEDGSRKKAIPQFEEFNRLCEVHGYYGCLSGHSSYLSAAGVMYQHAQQAIRLGKVLCEDSKLRLFDYEDYCSYIYVEMLSNGIFNDFHKGQLFYLCHQSAILIARYDMAHDSNLLAILKVYIENNCNTVKTAKDLFLHRNTLLKKLNTIRDLIGDDIESNYTLQERILFSCHVIDYARKYRKEDIFTKYEELK